MSSACRSKWVEMMPTDTSRVPDSGPTVASRSTTMSGNALKDACIKIKSVLIEEASETDRLPGIGNYVRRRNSQIRREEFATNQYY